MCSSWKVNMEILNIIEEVTRTMNNNEFVVKIAMGAAVAAASVFFLYRRRATRRLSSLRALWESRGRGEVTLHMYHRAKTGPNASPFPVKLEMFLKIMGIRYHVDFDEPRSTKGKSPWITVNGVDVADSQLAIQHLTKTLGKDLESGLSPEEKAISKSFRSLLEDHLYFCICLERWVYDEARDTFAFFPPLFPAWMPERLRYFLLKNYGQKKLVIPQCNGQGMGRHSKEEVLEFGKSDLTALSDYLGNKTYLVGQSGPSLADVSLFAFVCMFKMLPEDSRSEMRKHLFDRCKNLLQHHQRMVEEYWPDFEDSKFKNG